MPYIKQKDRPTIDEKITNIISHISQLPAEEQDGVLNYTVTQMIKQIYPERYYHYNRAVGVLESIKLELYRHRVGPYEDTKIIENGDV